MEHIKIFETEWLEFWLIERKTITKIISVENLSRSCKLGIIKWYPSWRHYCFFPTIEIETVYSDRCLIDIGNFISKLNEEHKLDGTHN